MNQIIPIIIFIADAIIVLHPSMNFTAFVIFLLCYLFAKTVHLIIHELGHLIGGFLDGYSFYSLDVGSLQLKKNESDKIVVSFKFTRHGQCVMIPPLSGKKHYVKYNIGGIVANCILGIMSWIPFFMLEGVGKLIMLQFMFVAVSKVIVNGIPHKRNTFPNDAYTIKLLHDSDEAYQDYVRYLNLYYLLSTHQDFDKSQFEYPRTLLNDKDDLLYYDALCDLLASCT